jgi:hypothetical protein
MQSQGGDTTSSALTEGCSNKAVKAEIAPLAMQSCLPEEDNEIVTCQAALTFSITASTRIRAINAADAQASTQD